MTKIMLSPHAASRIRDRLKDIVTLREVAEGVIGCRFYCGETWIKIKELDNIVEIAEENQVIYGDVVYVVVRRFDDNDVGSVTTVLLRERHQHIKGDYFIDKVKP
jgi:hypothetical protein